jgi:hypothetical protein
MGPEMSKNQISINNQNGSVIVVTLLILALMTIIGISSANTVVQELFITRNAGLYKQNTYLSESVINEAIQDLMIRSWDNDPNVRMQLVPTQTTLDWVHNLQQWEDNNTLDDWYDPQSTLRFLDVDGVGDPIFRVPLSIQNDDLETINIRGEKANTPLRYAVVLNQSDEDSLKETNPFIKLKGHIICEYISIHGMVRMESGVRLRVPVN